MSRILVFAGPTLTSAQIHALVPDVEICPPVAAGDLLRIPLAPSDLVAIIDGFFYQSAAVRHKEILDLLKRGVHVWGAASMGALRAAELAPFGMRGFGRIFTSYVRGEIEGDDEVTVLHAPADMEYLNLTEALVNIKYACECAIGAGVILASTSHMITHIAAGLPFLERVYPHILKQAVEQGLPQHEADALLNFVRLERPNLKQRDALELIQALQTPPSEPMCATFEWHETNYIHSWRREEQGIYVDEEHWVSGIDALTVYQLFCREYPCIYYHLLLESLTQIAARYLNISDAEEASATQVARYLTRRYGFSLEKGLPESAGRWLRPEEKTLQYSEQLARLAVRLWCEPRSFDWRMTVLRYVKEHAIIDSLINIVIQARAFNAKLWGQEAATRPETLPAELVYSWFAQRWGVEEAELEFTALDRGFHDLTDLLDKARPFYMFDKYVGVEKWEGGMFARSEHCYFQGTEDRSV